MWKDYEVTINFCGFIGAEQTYTVYAPSLEDAEEEALQMAYDDLTVSEIEISEE